jgi:vitamin B12 transporter
MTRLLLTAAALALLPTLARAQNEDIVVTATRAEQDANQVGQSITTINAATLETRQSSVLADILATTPGITAARNGGVGGTTSLFIRGASSEHSLVVIDGVRVNDPSSPGGAYDFGGLLAGDVSRVEVLRGADSVPWGSSAIGGVIDITTFAPTSNLSGTASAEGGSHGTSNLNAHLADTIGPVGIALGGGWYHTSGISAFAASEGGKEADGYDQHYANARVTVRLNHNFWLDLRGRYARGNAAQDGYNTPTFRFGDDSEYTITREASGYAALHDSFSNGRFTDTYAYSITNIHRDTFDAAQSPSFEFGYRGQVERLEYEGEAKLNPVIRLAYGAESERSSLSSPADIYGDPAAAYRTGIDSGYGQAILTPTRRLSLTGGLRYDHHRAYGGHMTFAANGAYRLTDTTTLRASYAEGFKAPTLYQLYAPYYGTPTLRPETATSYDGGIEQSALGGAIRVRATYFNRHTNDLIDFDPATFTYRNINRARAEGGEFELALHPIAQLTIAANYTRTHSINADTGLLLARRPQDSVNVAVDWAGARIKLGGTVQMIGNSYDDAANKVLLQSHALVGLHAAIPINEHLEAFGRIDNLFDEQYQVVRHYGTLGRAAYAGIRVKI